jgi:serine phosphatase RsbU (regulator of sigma subunit)
MIFEETEREAPAHKREWFSSWAANGGDESAGGDWTTIIPVSRDSVALTIGDVAGHGLTAAKRRKRIHSTVLDALSRTHVPSTVLQAANTAAYGDDPPVIVTAIVAIFDRRYRTLTFASAGHPPPLLCSAEHHAFIEHPPADIPLGIYARHNAADYVISLPEDALLVMYTDGITEHKLNLLEGEEELIRAVRWTQARRERDAAETIAREMLATVRGGDDAATLALQLFNVEAPMEVQDQRPLPHRKRSTFTNGSSSFR